MNRIIFAIMVCLLVSCGGGGGGGSSPSSGGAPAGSLAISNLAVSPSQTSESADKTVSVTGSFTFADDGGNLSTIEIANSQGHTLQVLNISTPGLTSGPISFFVQVQDSGPGSMGFEVFVTDSRGMKSNTLTGSIGITAGTDPPNPPGPGMPIGLVVIPMDSNDIAITLNPSSGNTGVVGYKIYRLGTLDKTITTTTFTDPGLVGGFQYCYSVTAIDASGNESPKTPQVCVLTPAEIEIPQD